MRELRFVAGALLLIGMSVVGFKFPSQPPAAWTEASGVRLDSEACRGLWEAREETTFTWPGTEEQPVTVEEVARRFDLELELVCRANSKPPECGASTLAPGQQIVLPLAPKTPGVASPSGIAASSPPAEEAVP